MQKAVLLNTKGTFHEELNNFETAVVIKVASLMTSILLKRPLVILAVFDNMNRFGLI